MLYKKLIRDLKDNPTTIIDLAKKYKISRSQVKKSLTELRKQGIFIDKIKTDEATKYFIPLRLPKQEEYKTEINHFALMGDTHLGSRYAEQECLNDFYDKVDEAGIHHVIHAGDLVEGTTVYRGQINDLEPDCVSLEGQIEKAIKEYPRKKDVQTIIISGNHDLRQFERQGVDPVKMVASKRRDFKFIGQWYGRVRLEDDVLLEVTHASGNSPYTKGYKFRTYLRERPINTYPDILAMGHLHSALFEDVQGTLSYLVGCFMGDTDYTRKKGLTPSVGGWLVELDIDKTIKRVKNEFVRY